MYQPPLTSTVVQISVVARKYFHLLKFLKGKGVEHRAGGEDKGANQENH